MLSQLKWRTLNDADINQIPFGAKKRSFKCDYRGFGGWRGRNVADFLRDLNQTHIASKTKKIWYMYPESAKFRLFSNFMMIFAYITSIFVGLKICLKIGFPWNFKGPQNLDEEVGTPNFFQKGSHSNTWPPKTPISMCGHQAHGQNSATKSSARKNLRET